MALDKPPGSCQFFRFCNKPAVCIIKHPVMGDVPCCELHADFAEVQGFYSGLTMQQMQELRYRRLDQLSLEELEALGNKRLEIVAKAREASKGDAGKEQG